MENSIFMAIILVRGTYGKYKDYTNAYIRENIYFQGSKSQLSALFPKQGARGARSCNFSRLGEDTGKVAKIPEVFFYVGKFVVTKSQSFWKVVVDCILSYPNEKEFVIIDFKTSGIPENLDIRKNFTSVQLQNLTSFLQLTKMPLRQNV